MTSLPTRERPPVLLPEVDTPALVVDDVILEANIARVSAQARQAGLALWPHAKTHKSVQVARRQMESGATGITVAKPQEAMVFWRAGLRPIFLAYPPVGMHKLDALRPMIRDEALIVGLDDLVTAEPLGALAVACGLTLPIMVEVDVGMQRAGVEWGGKQPVWHCRSRMSLALNYAASFATRATHTTFDQANCPSSRQRSPAACVKPPNSFAQRAKLAPS